MTDEALCFEILPKVSRSFALAIDALPDPLKIQVCVAYLLCRIVDTIEDHPDLQEKGPYFDCFDVLLTGAAESSREHLIKLTGLQVPQPGDAALYKILGQVFSVYWGFPLAVREALETNILEMSQGMRKYTTQSGGIVLRTTPDLDRYCFYVAGTVGNLLTDLFWDFLRNHEIHGKSGKFDERWYKIQRYRGYHFALGLQKVNMIKDVVKDLKERGSLFVPQAWLTEFQISPQDLLQGEDHPRVRALLMFFIRQAAKHLELARDYILDLPSEPRGMRLFCIWPYSMAVETLQVATQQSGLFTAQHEIKVSRKDMYRMMKATRILAKNRFALQLFLNHRMSRLMDLV